jgi:Ca2+-binding RTX toxin-like protein
VGGNIKVASFNVLNYFTTIDTVGGSNSPRGADSLAEFNRQTTKLVQALKGLNADVFGLIELENNGDAPGGGAIKAIVDALNAEVGANTYNFINTGKVGIDAITVGLIYKQGVVAPKGNFAVLDTPSFTDPNNTGQQRNRPAIAQTFQVIDPNNNDFGEAFNVVVNHFKSKGASGATGADLDQNDGQGAWNDTRTKTAQALAAWLTTDPTGQGDVDWLIIGDLNAYKGETPITTLKNAGYLDLAERFLGANSYSYLFNGQLGYLDYALANTALLPQVTGVTEWHINADEIPLFDYNDTIQDTPGEASFERKPSGNNLYEPNAFRTSDHDPVLVGLNLESSSSGTAGNDTIVGLISSPNILNGFAGNDLLIGGNLADTLNGGAGDDTILGGAGNDTIFGEDGNDMILGEGGDDSIVGGTGNDTILGGAGNDTIVGGAGNNIILGEVGNDTLYGSDGKDIMLGGADNDVLVGGAGDDALLGEAGNDYLDGGDGNDYIDGGAGDDSLLGGAGSDVLLGGDGNDYLDGGAGNDALIGGLGADGLVGGTGSDRFGFATNAPFNAAPIGNDIIVDFNPADDFIVLSKTTFTAFTASSGSVFDGGTPIAAADFAVIGSGGTAAAGNSSALIVYETSTGALYYNPDRATAGLGTGGQFATVSGAPSIPANRILIVS